MSNENMSLNTKAGATLWEGRMAAGVSEIFSIYVDSIGFDIVLAPFDVTVSKAHAKMLASQKIIDKETCQSILDGFSVIEHEIQSGEFAAGIVPTDEDVHTAIERRLTEITGDAGRALHTGRSRNDLVQMSVRLYARDAVIRLKSRIDEMITTLCSLAEKNIDILFPGKTHLQHAQPILLSHWLLSHAYRLLNDRSRLDDVYKRINVCVLGSGALAGSTLNLDPEFVAKELGTGHVVPNSTFGVSTRDYVNEVLFICAQIVNNLSCLGEDIVWMTSTECGYATLDDNFSSGSSMMPQKKNPDIAELVRGKAGLCIGSLTGSLSATKSQIFGYNHDLQVDKEALFSSIRDCELSILAMDSMMETTVFNKAVCENSLVTQPLLLATDIAEKMVNNGTPFRIAYKAVAVCIKRALEQNLDANQICKYLIEDDLIGQASKEVFGGADTSLLEAMKRSVENRKTRPGTGTENVKSQISELRKAIA
ncbi:MAG: argininosuccinate lyase [Acidimicrobiia bacterium]